MAFQTLLTPELIDRYTSSGAWVDRVITDYLDQNAEATPDKIAFIDPLSGPFANVGEVMRNHVLYANLRADRRGRTDAG